jgi:uncharacterized protein (DUF2141 family)
MLMKRINPVFVLLTLIGLSSGFLLIQDSMLQEETATAARVDSKTTARLDSKSTLLSANDSVTSASADTTPAEGQEQMFCVIGLKAKSSSVYVAVFESEAGFPRSELSSKTTIVSATEDQVRFSLELPRNQPVAIAVFQDIDGNGRLSKNQFGIPTEPYGFSNNARGLLGPPSFSQAVFTIGNDREPGQPIEISVQ